MHPSSSNNSLDSSFLIHKRRYIDSSLSIIPDPFFIIHNLSSILPYPDTFMHHFSSIHPFLSINLDQYLLIQRFRIIHPLPNNYFHSSSYGYLDSPFLIHSSPYRYLDSNLLIHKLSSLLTHP